MAPRSFVTHLMTLLLVAGKRYLIRFVDMGWKTFESWTVTEPKVYVGSRSCVCSTYIETCTAHLTTTTQCTLSKGLCKGNKHQQTHHEHLKGMIMIFECFYVTLDLRMSLIPLQPLVSWISLLKSHIHLLFQFLEVMVFTYEKVYGTYESKQQVSAMYF